MRAVLTLEFDNVAELSAYLSQQAGTQTAPFIPVAQPQPAPGADAPAKRGRPRKTTTPEPQPEAPKSAEAEPVKAEPAPAVEQPAPAPQPQATPAQTVASGQADALPWPATFEGAKTALKEVFNLKGAGGATELLVSCGATRISEVKPADFAKFIANAAKALGK